MIKKSLTLQGHRTSVALEKEFWDVIEDAAQSANQSLPEFLARRDQERVSKRLLQGLASYLRVWALNHVAQSQTIASEHSQNS